MLAAKPTRKSILPSWILPLTSQMLALDGWRGVRAAWLGGGSRRLVSLVALYGKAQADIFAQAAKQPGEETPFCLAREQMERREEAIIRLLQRMTPAEKSRIRPELWEMLTKPEAVSFWVGEDGPRSSAAYRLFFLLMDHGVSPYVPLREEPFAHLRDRRHNGRALVEMASVCSTIREISTTPPFLGKEKEYDLATEAIVLHGVKKAREEGWWPLGGGEFELQKLLRHHPDGMEKLLDNMPAPVLFGKHSGGNLLSRIPLPTLGVVLRHPGAREALCKRGESGRREWPENAVSILPLADFVGQCAWHPEHIQAYRMIKEAMGKDFEALKDEVLAEFIRGRSKLAFQMEGDDLMRLCKDPWLDLNGVRKHALDLFIEGLADWRGSKEECPAAWLDWMIGVPGWDMPGPDGSTFFQKLRLVERDTGASATLYTVTHTLETLWKKQQLEQVVEGGTVTPARRPRM